LTGLGDFSSGGSGHGLGEPKEMQINIE